MNHELVNRTLTSLLLLPVLVYATYYSGIYLIALLSIVYLISFYEIIKNTKNLLFIVISNFFLIFAFFSFYYLRGSTNYSLFTIYWILISTILSDIGGYTLGKTLKGKKLTKISPNKTYSGSAGSFLFSLFSLPFLNFIQSFVFSEMFINFYQIKYLLLTLAISTVCQFGDLCVSYCKRRSKIKDISNILPGHGGVLDRIDGLIFVLIFSLILKKSGLI